MLPERRCCWEEIKIESQLKTGAEGEVHCAFDFKAKEWRAVKIKPVKEYDVRPLEEVKCLMLLSNEHCIQMYKYCRNPWDFDLWICTEYCNEGDLGDLLRSFSCKGGTADTHPFPSRRTTKCTAPICLLECEVRDFMAQLLMGLTHIHANCIIHGDIKLDNILLHNPCNKNVEKSVSLISEHSPFSSAPGLTSDDGIYTKEKFLEDSTTTRASSPHNILVDGCSTPAPLKPIGSPNYADRRGWIAKFADFGSSTRLATASEFGRLTQGTPAFSSPEMMQNQSYSIATDVWSLGVCFYALLTGGVLPFPIHLPCDSESDLRNDIIHCTPPHPYEVLLQGYSASPYSRALGDVVMEMLTKPFSQRPSASDLLSRPVFQPSFDELFWSPFSRTLRTNDTNTGTEKASDSDMRNGERGMTRPLKQEDKLPVVLSNETLNVYRTHLSKSPFFLPPTPFCFPPTPFFLCPDSISRDHRPLAIPFMVVVCKKEGIKVYDGPFESATVVYRLFYGDQVYVHPSAMAFFLKGTPSSPAAGNSSRSALRQQEKKKLKKTQYLSVIKSPSGEIPDDFPSLLIVKILHPHLGYARLYASGRHFLLPLCHLPSDLIPSSVSLYPPCETEFGPPNVPRRFNF